MGASIKYVCSGRGRGGGQAKSVQVRTRGEGVNAKSVRTLEKKRYLNVI